MADRRPPSDVGRHARLELVFRAKGGVTHLVHAYAEPPLRVGRALPDGGGVHLILASSAPGVFGSDLFDQHVVVDTGARVRLTSQASLQVHPAVGGGAARLQSVFDVADGAELSCEWDPLIPFAASCLDQRIDVRLAPTARLVWSDAFMAGREGRGERWRFADLRHELRLTRAGTAEYLERYRIQPDDDDPGRRWTADDCCYFGSTIASGWDVTEDAVERLHHDLAECAGVHAAADRLAPSVVLARLAGARGPAFHGARARVLSAFASSLGT